MSFFASSSAAASSSSSSSSFEAPWIEKYRPEVLADIVGNTEAVERLSAIAQTGNLPNIILTGPPGIGKTTSVLCLAREMLGEHYKQAVLELNASDARGIDVVRNKIKMFAQKKVTLPKGKHKLIILDEADSMTAAAQQALRRTMELYSATTRFALACNRSTQIIEPIQSRCAVLRFNRLSDAEVVSRLLHVMQQEGVVYDNAGIEAIVFVAEGDMRNALNALQSTVSGFQTLTAEHVYKVCDTPQPAKIRVAIEKAREGKSKDALDVILALCGAGYSPTDIIQTIFKVAKSHPMGESEKLEMLREIGFTHMRIAEGLNSQLQLLGCVSRLCALSSAAHA